MEVGGGIRSMEDVDFYLSKGVSRVILGTAALEDETFIKAALDKYKEKIAVGIDCKDGFVCGHGWLSESKWQYIDFAKKMEAMGVKTIIVTDISKDGTLQGPNFDMYEQIARTSTINFVVSRGH